MAERIDIIISERGSRTVRRNIEDIGRGAQTSQSAVQLLNRALGAIGTGVAIRQLQQIVDGYTNVQNRLRNVTTGTNQLAAVTSELFAISNRSRSSFEATAEVYARSALALQDLGVSSKEVLQLTESLNQAIILSGASAQEAQAGLIQFSQGLASNTLRGDELRSVLEQLPAVADVIARGLGVTRGELRGLAAEGKITAGAILSAFQDAREELAVRFAKTVPTIGQAFQVFRNNLVQFIGGLDQATGGSSALARIIISLATNMETLGRAAGAAALTIGTVLAGRAIPAAIRAVNALTAAIAANPLGALLVVLTTVISTLVAFSDQIEISSDGVVTLRDVGLAVFEEIRAGIATVSEFLSEGFNSAISSVTEAFASLGITYGDVLTGARTFINRYLGFYVGLGQAIGVVFSELSKLVTDNFGGVIETVRSVVSSVIDFARKAFAAIASVATRILKAVGAVGAQVAGAVGESFGGIDFKVPDRVVDFGVRVRDAFLDGFNRDIIGEISAFIDPAFQRIASRARELGQSRIKAEADRIAAEQAGRDQLSTPGTDKSGGKTSREFNQAIKDLKQENELLRLNTQERAILKAQLEVEADTKRKLTEAEKQIVADLVTENQILQQRSSLYDEIRGPQENLQRGQEALNSLLADGSITTEEYNQKLRELQQEALATSTTLEGGLQRGLLTIGERFGDVASIAEDTLVNAFGAAEDALVEFVKTGKLDFSSLIDSIISDLARLAVRQFITAPLAGALGLAGTSSGTASSGGGLFGDLFGGLFGFQTGGSFTVGGSGAPDSQLVAFRATPGERVDISTPAQQASGSNSNVRGGDNITVQFNVTTPDASSFKRSRAQLTAQFAAELARAKERNT